MHVQLLMIFRNAIMAVEQSKTLIKNQFIFTVRGEYSRDI